MADIVIDTDVASVLQKGTAPAWVAQHVTGSTVWLTFVTVGELYKWAEVRSWAGPARSRLEAWISGRRLIPYDVEVARSWARLSGGDSCVGGRGRRTTPGSLRAVSATASRC